MAKLEDLMSLRGLRTSLEGGFVKKQIHPTLPLVIFNYTDKTQVNHHWNEVTKQCRGLIVNAETDEVVARPFPKFFNYGENGAEVRPDEPVIVTDKLDGSLGILYPKGDGEYAIATRGSFESEQAVHATRVWNDRYRGGFNPHPDYTYLFEILYPENRIVVDYAGADDLYLLGAIEHKTGISLSAPEISNWPGPRAIQLPYDELKEALGAAPRNNAEGMVVHFLHSDTRVKIKQDDYVALHKIVTGLNERTIWESIRNRTYVHLIGSLPDEFYVWTEGVAAKLWDRSLNMDADVTARYEELCIDKLNVPDKRKEFALEIRDEEPWMKACLFSLLDNKDYRDIIWKQIKPAVN